MNADFPATLPTALVIFGGTGDLAQTKLLPALFRLYVLGALPKVFTVIGLSRKELSDQEYQSFARECIVATKMRPDAIQLDEFCAQLRYVSGSFLENEAYQAVRDRLLSFDAEVAQCTNKLFYLAVPPQFYQAIFTKLSSSGVMNLCDGISSWSRLLVEKPFGKNLTTAVALEEQLCELFADDQIYRIDHYLAKDAIENIIALRFANTIVADSWTNSQIESIAIRLFETKNVSNRGAFYDDIGTLRDVGQNHLLQIFALLTMTEVSITDAASVRAARTNALQDLPDSEIVSLTRGQYDGYTRTVGVEPGSQTETYFRVTLKAQSELWNGVRFEFEAGKALDRSINEAVVTFVPYTQCHCGYVPGVHQHQNTLRIAFSPEQEISLSVWMKKPGFGFVLQKKELVLAHSDTTDTHGPAAYERVLFDCIVGDQTRFVSGAEVEAAWQFITPLLEQFNSLPLHTYGQGSSGPTNTSD